MSTTRREMLRNALVAAAAAPALRVYAQTPAQPPPAHAAPTPRAESELNYRPVITPNNRGG